MKKQANETLMLRMLTRRAWQKQDGKCFHCSEYIPLPQATGDHLIPRYQGGHTIAGNIVAACADCNNHRNDETNRRGGKFNITVGDDTPRSPFEVLRNYGRKNSATPSS